MENVHKQTENPPTTKATSQNYMKIFPLYKITPSQEASPEK